MRERPILFSPPMVKAILDDRKTQTRRPLRDQKPIDLGASMHGTHLTRRAVHDHGRLVGHRNAIVRCPYGQPGDRLWVRERHCFLDVKRSALSQFPLGPQNNDEVGPDIWNLCIEYSDGSENETSFEGKKPKQTRERGEFKWRPGMFMPRWASRLALEVTAVRVERLQEISEEDALAEGISRRPIEGEPDLSLPARDGYQWLWDTLNADRGFGWDKNPWVWVVEFKKP